MWAFHFFKQRNPPEAADPCNASEKMEIGSIRTVHVTRGRSAGRPARHLADRCSRTDHQVPPAGLSVNYLDFKKNVF